MTDQHRFAYADHFDHDLYTRTRTRDRFLNAAIDPRTGSTHRLFDFLDWIHVVTAHIPDRGRH